MAAQPNESLTVMNNANGSSSRLSGSRPGMVTRDSTNSSGSGSRTSTQDREAVMAKYLYRKCLASKWLEPTEGEAGSTLESASNLGVVMRKADGTYVSDPVLVNPEVVQAVERMGLTVAITMSSEITASLIQSLTPFQTEISLDDDPHGFALPIVPSVRDLGTARCANVTKEAYMVCCRAEKFVLIWSDFAQGILAHGADVETRLLSIFWGSHIQTATPRQFRNSFRNSGFRQPPAGGPADARVSHSPYIIAGSGSHTPRNDTAMYEKADIVRAAVEKEELGTKLYDPERDGTGVPKRPFLLSHAVMIGLAMALVVVVEMACVAKLITEIRLDGKMMRLALLATVPLFGAFSMFFMVVITGSAFQLFGPLTNVQNNSMYYSAKAPQRGRYPDLELPHVTVQMPVYKEGLKGVVIPTVTSLLAAVRNYEEQGGTASIYVNDDGMRLVDEELAEARKAFYDLNGIGWCARPKHNVNVPKDDPDYFERRGHFKKASNMNYCLDFSIRVEDELLRLIDVRCQERGCTPEDVTIEEENELYELALQSQIDADGGKTWAAGNVRIGEIILIVDSDTRVPEDSFLYGALEMYESPEVALLQHASGIMQVVNNAFENGITYFTDLIYTSIQFAVGSGDCAPFVGHNTFIRWKAIQSISYQQDGKTKFWSEEHVSEDFDVSLRLQMAGFVVRLATYHNGGFKEGVSLTVYDELSRWEKYAYGCNELVFNPIIYWPVRGPFTRLFMRFLWSNIKITSKITILSYIGTYYAIASAIPLTLANYLIVGWFTDEIDQFYITSWRIFVGMAVVFNVISPIAYAMLRHRLGQKKFFVSLWETAKWTPMFLLFFGGISYHLLCAIFCHFFSIKMEWTTTAKELEEGGFRIGLDRIVRDFKWMYLFLVPVAAGMIYLAEYSPRGWLITDFAAIVPIANQIGCHALLPFALGLF